MDAAMVFGTGFAPFTGGPMNYVIEQNPADMFDRIKQLHRKYGERFSPADGWQSLSDQQ